MGTVFVGTHLVRDPGFATMLVRSGAEAGIVGGLADWFAVTALFRHPLGLPIPHTAIIPNNKDRIGRTLGRFVERHFLTHEIVVRKLRDAQVGRRFATWLAAPETAPMIAEAIVAGLPYLIRSLGSRDLHEFARRTLGEQLIPSPKVTDSSGAFAGELCVIHPCDHHPGDRHGRACPPSHRLRC